MHPHQTPTSTSISSSSQQKETATGNADAVSTFSTAESSCTLNGSTLLLNINEMLPFIRFGVLIAPAKPQQQHAMKTCQDRRRGLAPKTASYAHTVFARLKGIEKCDWRGF